VTGEERRLTPPTLPDRLDPWPGVFVRVAQRLLALTTAIWHNWTIGAATQRSRIAYDH